MMLELHIDADEAHHAYVVRSSAVEHLIVAQEDAGSNPVAPPEIDFSVDCYVGERFSLPTSHVGVGRVEHSPSVAQLVERQIEALRVAGSTPARGTGKLKL